MWLGRLCGNVPGVLIINSILVVLVIFVIVSALYCTP